MLLSCLRPHFLRLLPPYATATMCRFVIYKGTSPVQLSHVSCQVQLLSGSDLTSLPMSSSLPDHVIPLSTKPLTPVCESTDDDPWTVMVLESVCPSRGPMEVDTHAISTTGWYDSVFDEELGSQPCIFTSVTPVSNSLLSLSLHYKNPSLGMEQCQLDSPSWENQVPSRVVRAKHIIFRKVSMNFLTSGHVRATTAGSLSLDNCHPFVHGKLMVVSFK